MFNHHFSLQRQLVHVALLKQEPGASFTLVGDSSSVPCICFHFRPSHIHFKQPTTEYALDII